MIVLRYFLIIIQSFPLIFIANVICLSLLGLTETLTVVAITPIIDLYTNSATQHYSSITLKFIAWAEKFSLVPTLKLFVFFFLAITILKSVLNLVFKYVTLQTKYSFLEKFIVGSFSTFFKSSLPFFNSVKQGVLINTFVNEISTVGNSLSSLSLLMANFFRFSFFIIVPFAISWELTIITFFLFGLVSLPSLLGDKLSYHMGKKNVETANNIQVVLQESITAVKVVLGFGNNEKAITDYGHAFNYHRQVTIPFQMIASSLSAIFEPVLMIVLFFVLYLALYVYKISLPEVLVMLFAFKSMVPLILSAMTEKNNIMGFLPSYEQVTHLQDTAQKFNLPDGSQLFPGLHSSIEVNNLHFFYNPEREILKGINLKIKKGEMVALVGKSGSGKTTVTDLLLGFYRPQKGEIKIDGINLSQFQINSFRNKVGYVPQEPVLFNRTIRENLLWSYGEGSAEDIRHACCLAHADGFIKKLSHEYDTLIGDRGAKLSGGERQRVAFARALIRKPDLLVLDEATSALDTESELAIQKAIDEVAETKNTTILVIAHRLSTIKRADRIYVFEDGQIVGEGNFETLAKENTAFKKLLETV